MTQIFQTIKDLFSKKQPLPPGMYSYQTPQDAEEQYRLHLRIEQDGKGILVINASTILHLNETAVEYAYHLIKQTNTETIMEKVSHRYQVDEEQVRADFQYFAEQIQTIIETPDLDPVTYLDIDRQEPYSGDISAPYRLDCALTYQVNAESKHSDAPLDRVDRELTKDEWIAVLHKAHNIGIPHLLFTGGEPTLREDLPDLIATAEELGLVTGLLSDGTKLKDDSYREVLLLNGLDHLMMIFEPEDKKNWEVLKKILAEDLFTTVHLTLRKGKNLEPYIKKLAEMGTNALSLSASDPELNEELQKLSDIAAVNQLELVWDMPVPYSSNNPVSLELEHDEFQKAPEGAGKAWLYVEPD
ncbi:MAG: hypothetical protein SVT56_09095, partial [Chloroflexota bacterium]|nr:hypothetical protein [Chloroflexota bacterium]